MPEYPHYTGPPPKGLGGAGRARLRRPRAGAPLAGRAEPRPRRAVRTRRGVGTIRRPRGARSGSGGFFSPTERGERVIDSIERAQVKKGLPSFDPGDRVRVHFQVIEGSRRRTQVFEGIVLKRQGSGARETFTVRKQSFGVGVERTFPLHSPKIEKLEIAARGDVRRAKLYYLRGRVGKAARVAERRWGIDEELISAPAARRPTSRRRSTPRASARPRPRSRKATRGAGGRRPRRPEERGDETPRTAAAEAEEAPEAEGREAPPRRGGPARSRAETSETEAERQGRPRTEPRRRMRSRPTRTATPARTRKTEDPEAAEPCRRADRARRHRGDGARPGAGDPGLAGQAVPDPLRIDGADARRRPAGARQPLPLPLHRSLDRRHRRLPPAGRAPTAAPNAASRTRRRRPARKPTAERVRARTSSSGSSPGPATRSRVRDGHPVVNGVEQEGRALHQSLRRRRRRCNLPKPITDPARLTTS